jgi:membrane protease YdiL (CAAX protease family)
MVDLIVLSSSILLGVAAVIQWRRSGVSIRKGFGFSFHWWSLGDFMGGFMIAFIAMIGIFLVELLLGVIHIWGFVPPGSDFLADIPNLLIYAMIEEVLFRSLLLSGLVIVLRGRKWSAILITSVLFGLAHLGNPHATPVSGIGNALGGLMYGIAFLGGKNVWLPWGLHFSWNFSQGPILGFPVSGLEMGGLFALQTTGSEILSGGAYGPEAGLVGMVFRFVIVGMLFVYLQWRCSFQGDLEKLEFPIRPI